MSELYENGASLTQNSNKTKPFVKMEITNSHEEIDILSSEKYFEITEKINSKKTNAAEVEKPEPKTQIISKKPSSDTVENRSVNPITVKRNVSTSATKSDIIKKLRKL